MKCNEEKSDFSFIGYDTEYRGSSPTFYMKRTSGFHWRSRFVPVSVCWCKSSEIIGGSKDEEPPLIQVVLHLWSSFLLVSWTHWEKRKPTNAEFNYNLELWTLYALIGKQPLALQWGIPEKETKTTQKQKQIISSQASLS